MATVILQFGFIYIVALLNLGAGFAAAMYLGYGPRNLNELFEPIRAFLPRRGKSDAGATAAADDSSTSIEI